MNSVRQSAREKHLDQRAKFYFVSFPFTALHPRIFRISFHPFTLSRFVALTGVPRPALPGDPDVHGQAGEQQ